MSEPEPLPILNPEAVKSLRDSMESYTNPFLPKHVARGLLGHIAALVEERDRALQSMQYAWEELAYTRQQRDAAVEVLRLIQHHPLNLEVRDFLARLTLSPPTKETD